VLQERTEFDQGPEFDGWKNCSVLVSNFASVLKDLDPTEIWSFTPPFESASVTMEYTKIFAKESVNGSIILFKTVERDIHDIYQWCV
jgi:hypothetical protein